MPINERRSLWRRAKPYLRVRSAADDHHPDAAQYQLLTLYSPASHPRKIEDHLRNILLCFFVMWVAANVTRR